MASSLKFWPRLISLCAALCIVFSIFYVGAKPEAAGLFKPPWDKVAHFVTYGAIAALLWHGLPKLSPLWLVLVVTAVGIADEIHQISLPGRFPGLDDLSVDIIAAVLVAGFLHWLQSRKKQTE